LWHPHFKVALWCSEIDKIQKKKFLSDKFLFGMAECGKEFGDDFTKTLLFGGHFNLVYFDKKCKLCFLSMK
jgi:hypothetical protein